MRISAAACRQWPVRYRAIHRRLDASHILGSAIARVHQPGDLRADRHARDRSGIAGEGDGDMSMNIAFPWAFDGTGRTATASDADHIRQMIEQLLFTAPGERVNQPDFGSGLMQMVFAPNSTELAAALQFTAQSAVQRYLGDLIDLRELQVVVSDATLTVTVQYVIRATQQPQVNTFSNAAA
jgi:phage baseplate assembly protein W